MDNILKELNIIETNNEELIGKVNNIMKAFFEMIKYDIENTEDLEEKFYTIKEKYNFIEELITKIEEEELFEDTIITVKYNPMGTFSYEEEAQKIVNRFKGEII